MKNSRFYKFKAVGAKITFVNTDYSTAYWTRATDSGIRLGLRSEFADSIKGNWVALELPPAGSVVERNDSFGFITTSKSTHELKAPWSFRVIRINQSCVENPGMARLSPYGEGWLLDLDPIDPVPITEP